MKISNNFTLEEFLKSSSYPEIPNNPSKEERENIIALVVNVLQPLRDSWGKPLSINSGFRSEELNKKVGGVSNSQHRNGQAADVRCSDPKGLLECLKKLNIDFDQVGVYSSFLHISYKKQGENRREVFYGKY